MVDTQLITGPAGELEIYLEARDPVSSVQAEGADPLAPQPVAICCHPHPLHGGSMQNKVVHILAKSFTELGAHVVRFNFRGVGQSTGAFAEGVGERDDLLAVVDWCQKNWPGAPIWLAGFSFGAYVAAMTHGQIEPQRLVLVAPPVDMYPEIKTIQIKTPGWLLIQGGQDEIVEANAVLAWAEQQTVAAETLFFAEAGHFFHGKLNLIKEGLLNTWAGS